MKSSQITLQDCIDHINGILKANRARLKKGDPQSPLLEEQNLIFGKTIRILKGIKPGGKLRDQIYAEEREDGLKSDIKEALMQMDDSETCGLNPNSLSEDDKFIKNVIELFYVKDATRSYWDNLHESMDAVIGAMAERVRK